MFVNGQLIDFISGDVDFTSYDIDLTGETNNVYWIYAKDPAESALEDAAYIRNVTFSGGTVTTPTTPVVTPPTPETARSKGRSAFSMGWMLLFAPALVWLRRRKA
mgnify:FL=1